MTLTELVDFAKNKTNFTSIDNYITFCLRYLEFAANSLQAVIVSQNENHYRFYQYKEDGSFNVTRPINTKLMYTPDAAKTIEADFIKTLLAAQEIKADDSQSRSLLCNSIYTLQQCIGAALDALPAGQSNTARKINGDLFERLIRLLIQKLDIDCTTGTIKVPIVVDNVEQFKMGYQHDLIIKQADELKVIGGVKTSSKDRIDKVFMDKFLYARLTGTDIPHIAIFLNDVQRKNTRTPGKYGISATFLPGHFKGYTIKLNPLDGVYYCDIRPNMLVDPILKVQIRTIDHFFCTDLWDFLAREGTHNVEIAGAANGNDGNNE